MDKLVKTMEAQPFTDNPHLDRFLTEMSGDMKDIQKTLLEQNEVHEKILAQTLKTNGRVTALETDVATRRSTNRIISYIVLPLVGILVSVIGWLSIQVYNMDDKFADALENYQSEIVQ